METAFTFNVVFAAAFAGNVGAISMYAAARHIMKYDRATAGTWLALIVPFVVFAMALLSVVL
jgi:hypothetical protein